MKNYIIMSPKEVKSLHLVEGVQAGRWTQNQAAQQAHITTRTMRRWTRKVEQSGPIGLVHGNRGKISSRKMPKKQQKQITNLVQRFYLDCTATFIAEKLKEKHQIIWHPKTIARHLRSTGIWESPVTKKRKNIKTQHRFWRERKKHRGELIQFDGSYHNWFEGRNGLDSCCLLASIDDATGEPLHLEFALHEGVLPVMGFWTTYIKKYGLPKNIYLDKFSTYRMHLKDARENQGLKTQLERAIATLGVELIFANSPQAKGRIERLFSTLQDRLVKELRLHHISTMAKANIFLQEKFISAFCRKFACPPQEPQNWHRTLSKKEQQQLPEILCRQETRTVLSDFTFSFGSYWYQILPTPGLAIRPKDEVLIRQYPDQTISFAIRNRKIRTERIAKRQSFKSSLTQSRFNKRHVPILAPQLTSSLTNRTFSLSQEADKIIVC